MFGTALYHAHRAFQAIGQWFSTPNDDPIIQRLYSARAYAKWQAQVKAQIKAAQGKHGRVSQIRERQTQTLHAALAANRQQGAG